MFLLKTSVFAFFGFKGRIEEIGLYFLFQWIVYTVSV